MSAQSSSYRRPSALRVTLLVTVILAAALAPAAGPVTSASAASTTVVISQVYGGGGNANATYTHDFVELRNVSTSSVTMTNWSVQYTSATGTGTFAGGRTVFSGSIPAGGYFLVQLASNGGTGAALPDADATGTSNMSVGGGKVVLSNQASGIECNGGTSAPCDDAQTALMVDRVGWGSANYYEGSAPAPAGGAATSTQRADNGCTDTDQNGSDFVAGTPNARNSETTAVSCAQETTPRLSITDATQSEGDAGTTTYSFTVSLQRAAGPGGVTFDIATADGTATAGTDYVAKSLTGQSIAEGQSIYSFDVAVNGDTTAEADETFFVNVTDVTGATVADGQGQGTIQNDDAGPPPTVTSVTRNGATPTSASSVAWTVTFSEAVTGVDLTDFALTTTGIAGASLRGVTRETASAYVVTAATGSGNGSIRLDVVDDDTVVDGDSIPLGGPGAGNGAFRTGGAYALTRGTGSETATPPREEAVPEAPGPVSAPPAEAEAAAVASPWQLVRVAARRVVLARRGVLRLRTGYVVRCPQGVARCTGRVTVKLRRRSARTGRMVNVFLSGKARVRTIAGGTEQVVSFRLNRRARRLLRRLGSLTVVLRGSMRSDGGPAVVREVRLRIADPR